MTVNAAEPVLTMVAVYRSILEAFPAEGAMPNCHFGVTALPSIVKPV